MLRFQVYQNRNNFLANPIIANATYAQLIIGKNLKNYVLLFLSR